MKVEVINTVDTKSEITNANFNKWYDEENERRKQLSKVSNIMIGFLLLQMVYYVTEAYQQLNKRDDRIDDIISFMDYIQNKKHGVDLEMSKLKASVRNLALPDVDGCEDAIRFSNHGYADGEVVDDMSLQLSQSSCLGIPSNWSLHDGDVLQARDVANADAVIANNAVRQREWFQERKTVLMRSAQRNMKAPYSANETLQMYAQSMSIHSGLADMYIAGFNSAGAGLGVKIGQKQGVPQPSTQTTPTPEHTGVVASGGVMSG